MTSKQSALVMGRNFGAGGTRGWTKHSGLVAVAFTGLGKDRRGSLAESVGKSAGEDTAGIADIIGRARRIDATTTRI